jgi:hypothetical protein
MADEVSVPLEVKISSMFLRDACAAWAGIEAVLAYKEWRGLLHAAYETTSGFDYITPFDGNADRVWPERRDKAPRDLTHFDIGLPVPTHSIQIGDGNNTLPEAGFSLVSVDARRRRGVLEYRIGLSFDGVLDEGEQDDIFGLVPGIKEDDLPHHARAFFVVEWDEGYVVRNSLCIIELPKEDVPFGRNFSELTEEERIGLLDRL